MLLCGGVSACLSFSLCVPYCLCWVSIRAKALRVKSMVQMQKNQEPDLLRTGFGQRAMENWVMTLGLKTAMGEQKLDVEICG